MRTFKKWSINKRDIQHRYARRRFKWGSEYNNVALFEVDEGGKYTIIATPKYDELDNSYFYGDYAAKTLE